MNIILLLIAVVFTGCSNMKKISFDNNILCYQNYSTDSIHLPNEYFLESNFIYKNKTIVPYDMFMQSHYKNKIEGELFDFLCNIDLINGWFYYENYDVIPYSFDYQKNIEMGKEWIKLYNLGKIKLSKDYKSFLILKSYDINDALNTTKDVFLINVLNNSIVSILKISDYFCYEGTSGYSYARKLRNGEFLQKEIPLSSDVIIPKELKVDPDETWAKFMYDKQGRIKVLN